MPEVRCVSPADVMSSWICAVNDAVHFVWFLSEDVVCLCSSIRAPSLLLILWWKSWPCCVCELSMRLVALTADDYMHVGVWTCTRLLVYLCVCHSVSWHKPSIAHHAVRLSSKGASDCRFSLEADDNSSTYLEQPISHTHSALSFSGHTILFHFIHYESKILIAYYRIDYVYIHNYIDVNRQSYVEW